MKNFKFISLLLALVGVVAFTSCKEEWTPGAQDANMGAYFPSTQGFTVAATDTSVDVVVARIDSSKAAEVSVRAEDIDSSGLFEFSRSASFAAGETEAIYTISFDGSALEMGKKYSIRLQIDQAEASNYAVSEAIFTILVPEPWSAAGQGIYFDDFLCNMMEEADSFRGAGAYVQFEQSDLDANRLRAVNVFTPATIGAMWGAVPSWMTFTAGEENTYVEFDITDPAHVKLNEQIEVTFSDGTVGKAQIAPLHMQQATEDGTVYDLYLLVWHSEEDGESLIVLEDGIIKFPTDGSVELAAFYQGQYAGWFAQCNPSGYMQFYLPGVEFVNYDMQVSYDGMYVSADGATAQAIFNFALGADVASYKFAFVPGDVTADPSEAATAIVEGTIEPIFESDADTKRWEVELTKGVYTLVAVPYSAEGEARTQDVLAYNFYFNGTGEMPEVNIDVELGVPSQLTAPEKAEEVEANMPAPYYIGVKLAADASQLKSIKFWYGDKAAVEKAGLTLDELFADYAGNASVWIERLAENDGVMVGGFNVVNGSSNTVFLRFETIYGTTIDYISEEPYTTPAYDGDFYVGQYKFQDGEGENLSQVVFGVVPGKDYDHFYFTHSMIDGSMWSGIYDAEAATFTVSGECYGLENYGNLYGDFYAYIDPEKTQIYGYYSFASEESAGKDPMVFTVEDNMLKSLITTFTMLVFNAADGSLLGPYFSFSPTTVIAPYTQEVGPAAKALSASSSMKAVSLACGEAYYAGAGVSATAKTERVIKATPIEGRSFNPVAFTLQR